MHIRTQPIAPITTSSDQAILFTVELGKALHVCGTPAHRIEEAMTQAAEQLGLEVQVFTTPTSIFAGFGPLHRQDVRLLRVEPGDANLERLWRVDDVASRVTARRLAPAQAFLELEGILKAPCRYPTPLVVLAFGLSSMVAARFFGGGMTEIGAAGIIGVLVGALGAIAGRFQHMMRLVDFGSGVLAAALALVLARLMPPLSTYTATVAGLIVLMPGLTLTLAMNELATKHLVSGTSRLMYALTILFSVGFGFALGRQVEQVLPDPRLASAPLPAWTELVALCMAPIAYVVLFQARLRDAGVIAAAVFVAFLGARLGAQGLGPQVGACVGAFLVGSGANLHSRWKDQPAAIAILPGLLVLVPGSVGFKSLDALLGADVQSGISTAFQMVMVAAAIVAGLLVANVAVPPKKAT
ncbi:MAG: threonine/serine exporter family protein [Phycisphaerales bacterium]|nr:threonine/serine exporter family protein [Phycisphaerales bacterium]